MKYLLIFLLSLSFSLLDATFNLNAKKVTESPPSAINEENAYNSQGNFTPPSGRLNLLKEMSPSEQKATGLYRLNDNQKMALSKWIETWSESNQVRTARVIEKASPDAIAAILGDGHYVKMGDGTVWNVSPNGWIYTYYWKAGEIVKPTLGPDALFPYTLTNENYPLTVNAKKAVSHITRSFKNSYTIVDISSDGKYVTLDNGSKWQVPSAAQYMVAGWSNGNTVFITKVSKASGEHYELFNGVTARSTYVKMLKQGKSMDKKPSKKRSMPNMIPEKNQATSESQNTPQPNTSDDPNRSEGS